MKPKKQVRSELLSVVMPAYKAEKFIEKNIMTIKKVLDELPYNYELIIVSDGILDATIDKSQKIAKKYPDVIVATGYQNNMGKGHAVRFGMAQAKGDLIGFIDAGLDIDPSSIPLALEHFDWYKADIIVGSKRHPASKVYYPWQRRILSFGYQLGVRILFGLKVRDTQVGLKFFKRKVLEDTMPRLLVKQFAFDVEMLSVANYLGYRRIYETPIDLQMEFGASTILKKGFWRTVFNMAWETAAVFYRLRILRYYNTKNKRNWITPKYLTFKSR
jgi:glycosyltransferase involved in cell wall biosynthesis